MSGVLLQTHAGSELRWLIAHIRAFHPRRVDIHFPTEAAWRQCCAKPRSSRECRYRDGSKSGSSPYINPDRHAAPALSLQCRLTILSRILVRWAVIARYCTCTGPIKKPSATYGRFHESPKVVGERPSFLLEEETAHKGLGSLKPVRTGNHRWRTKTVSACHHQRLCGVRAVLFPERIQTCRTCCSQEELQFWRLQ